MAAQKSTTGLSGTLASRRAQAKEAAHGQEPWDVLKKTAQHALDPRSRHRTAELLGNDIAVALASEIEELNTYHHGFRSALHRMFTKVLRVSCEKPERVVLFHEAVPGYTLMLFKKDKWEPLEASPAPSIKERAKSKASALEDTAEGRAASVLIGEYVQRTGKRVIVIEYVDSLFLFFPAEDLRKNVRELGYFAIE